MCEQTTICLWGAILARLPRAKLVLDFTNFSDPHNQMHLRDFDVLLDCFPHRGGTMLLDAVRMGVPALTLAGCAPLRRIGTTFMMNLDLPQWVAPSALSVPRQAAVLA